jgi:hypothetical protein
MTLALWALALFAGVCALFGLAAGIALAAALLSPFLHRSL